MTSGAHGLAEDGAVATMMPKHPQGGPGRLSESASLPVPSLPESSLCVTETLSLSLPPSRTYPVTLSCSRPPYLLPLFLCFVSSSRLGLAHAPEAFLVDPLPLIPGMLAPSTRQSHADEIGHLKCVLIGHFKCTRTGGTGYRSEYDAKLSLVHYICLLIRPFDGVSASKERRGTISPDDFNFAARCQSCSKKLQIIST